MIDSALNYAKAKWPVFPLHSIKDGVCTCKLGASCHSPGKHPRTATGFKEGTTDASVITAWWKSHPDSNIGLWCKGLIVVDVDPRNGGDVSLDELFSSVADKHGFDTLTAITGGGGRHYLFSAPDDAAYDCKPVPGIEIKSAGGLIVVAPSIHMSGRRYEWEDDAIPVAPAPRWILDLIKKPEKAAERPVFTGKPLDLESFISKHAIPVRPPKISRCNFGGYQWDIIGGCPFQPDYLGGAPAIGVTAAGATWFSCFCGDHPAKTWKDFRTLYEPRKEASNGHHPHKVEEPIDDWNVEPPPDKTPRKPYRFMYNDTGNADRLVAAHGEDILWCEERRSFAIWTGSRWRLDKSIQPLQLARKALLAAHAEAGDIEDDKKRKEFLGFLNKSLSRAGIANMVEVAKLTLRGVGAADFDTNEYLLNFQNGTLDLRSGRLLDHNRNDLISRCIPYQFDPNAECPIFHEFLKRIMGVVPGAMIAERTRAERIIRYLQVILGCALTGKPEKILAIFWGSGNNGKTTLLETVRAALGEEEYAGQLQIESLMTKQAEAGASNMVNSDLAGLQGCRFVTASEPEKGMRFSVSRIKYITGLGRIKARYLNENPFTFAPSHKLFIDCNDKPVIGDPNDTIWNRVKLIPFTVVIPPEEIDTSLAGKLREELPGIMAWLAVGASEYIRAGIGTISEVSVATDEYRKDSDPLKEFFEDRCKFTPGNSLFWVSKTEMWAAYQSWTVANSIKHSLGKANFEERLQKRGCKENKKGPNRSIRAWEGVTIVPLQSTFTDEPPLPGSGVEIH